MHRLAVSTLAMFWFFGPVASFGAEEDARAIIARALQAQGGAEQVAKLTKARRATVKGQPREGKGDLLTRDMKLRQQAPAAAVSNHGHHDGPGATSGPGQPRQRRPQGRSLLQLALEAELEQLESPPRGSRSTGKNSRTTFPSGE